MTRTPSPNRSKILQYAEQGPQEALAILDQLVQSMSERDAGEFVSDNTDAGMEFWTEENEDDEDEDDDEDEEIYLPAHPDFSEHPTLFVWTMGKAYRVTQIFAGPDFVDRANDWLAEHPEAGIILDGKHFAIAAENEPTKGVTVSRPF